VALDLIFSFFTSRIGLIVIAAGLVFGWHVHDKRAAIKAFAAQAQLERRAAVAEYVVDMSARNTKLFADLATERGRIKTETQTLIREVNNYVTPLADTRCVVPAGFVQHHDAAWGLSDLPAAAPQLVDKPSGIPLSRVESVVSENAGICQEWRSEAIGWRDWYRTNSGAYNAWCRKYKTCKPIQ
jgi:hypothetical protein